MAPRTSSRESGGREPTEGATRARRGDRKKLSGGTFPCRHSFKTPSPEPRRSGLRCRARQYAEVQPLAVRRDVDLDLVALREVAHEDFLRERILDELLNRSLERTRAILLVVAVLHQEVGRRI